MDLTIIERNGKRVLTTAQLAESFGTTSEKISYNFNYNKERYSEGKHFISLTGEEKAEFLNRLEIHDGSKKAKFLYLWTEKGAWLHAKSLSTDKAWDAYELLVDKYYESVDQQVQKLPATYKEALLQLVAQVEENEKLHTSNLVLGQQIGELQPKATYYDLILQNKSLLVISKIAKDYGMSATAMNKKLNELKVQYRQGDIWLLYAKYQDKGYTQTSTWIQDADRSRVSTKWTQKGRLFIYELLKHEGVLPKIEQEEAGE